MNNNSVNKIINIISNSNDEVSFWKVMHNKYLFSLIIHSIDNDNDPINDTNERIKFKHIYSLDWMVKHKQLQLLKYKLSNDEYVDMDDFIGLLSLNISDCNEGGNNTSSTTPSTSSIDIELFKNVLQLVIKRLKKSYPSSKVDKLVLLSFEYSSLQVINLMFQYLDNGGSTTTTLESTLLNSYNSQSKDQINSFIKCAISNKHNNHSLLNIILDLITKQRQQLKQQQGISKLDLEVVLKIGNIEIQNKILDLELLVPNSHFIIIIVDYITVLFEGNKGTIELLLLGFKVIYRGQSERLQLLHQQISDYQQHGLDESLIFKEIFKQFIMLTKPLELFLIYLSRLSELLPIKDYYIYAFEYSTQHFNTDILNQLNDGELIKTLFYEKNREYQSKSKPFVFNNLSKSIEFLKLYLSKLPINDDTKDGNDVVIWNTIKIIYDIVFEIQDPIQYEQLVNSNEIIPDQYKVYLPLKWNPIINKLNCSKDTLTDINDSETIDWMKEWFLKCKSTSYIWDLLLDLMVFKRQCNFNTVKLSVYASNQLSFIIEGSKLFNISAFYKISFLKAIVEFDLETIKYICSFVSFSNYSIEKSDLVKILPYAKLGASIITSSNDINYQKLNEFIDYLNPVGTNPNYSFYRLIGFIVDNGYYNDSKFNNNDDHNNHNEFIKFDLEKVKFNIFDQLAIINNLYQVWSNYNHLKLFLENLKFTYQGQVKIKESYIFNNDKNKTNLIISLIQLFIDQLNQCREIIQNSTKITTNQEPLPNLQIYYKFLNSLFNSISFQNNDLKLEHIHQIYQLFIDNQVEIVLGNQIKMGYIKCKYPVLYYKYLNGKTLSNSHIPIPSQVELFKHSFDQLLDILIYRPYLTNQNNEEISDGSDNFIEYNLMFFLQIKRIDLYLNELQLIKSKLGITVLPTNKLIKECCINLELNSISNTLIEIENIKTNTKSKLTLFQICTISLKFGAFEISKLALNTFNKCLNNNQIQLNNGSDIKLSNFDDINYIKENLYSIIETIDNIQDQ